MNSDFFKKKHNVSNPANAAKLVGKVEDISGTIESIVYRSEESGYTVCRVNIPGSAEPVIVVGNCPVIWPGEDIKARGEWTRHKQFGLQLKADTLISIPPASRKGIEKFLASGRIRGVGKTTAKNIVDAFGTDALRVIEKESQRLEEVTGIGKSKRQMIKESWIENQGVRDIMVFLHSHGVGNAQAMRIFKQYGNEAVSLIRENPYRLCREVWGIGFKSADSIAMSLGVPQDSEMRARAGLIYTLQTLADEGHCFAPEQDLIEHAGTALNIPLPIVEHALQAEVNRNGLVNAKGHIYIPELYDAEINTARNIARLSKSASSFDGIAFEKAIPWASEKAEIAFAEKQREALQMVLTQKVSIITGGPGVGKTTIIRALVDIFRIRNLRVAMCAPTGRAAKRMEEATGQSASTIHRLLKYLPHLNRFDHDSSNPLEHDVFIVDEVSMIDISLMHSFLNALPDYAWLVLVGDVDQLPSVGPGNVLRDLIDSKLMPCTKLDIIFRQQSGGNIVTNAHRINNGEGLEINNEDELSDMYFFPVSDPDQAISTTINLIKRISEKFEFDPMTEVQILTPMRKNQLGADNLNAVIQGVLNPHGPGIHRFGRDYRTGDRVMQIRNNYDKDVYNGDIGLIKHVDTEAHTLTVDFDSFLVKYEQQEIDELVHAYACSIHKSQGSEYPAVIILVTTQHFKLLQRNLIYTAITRGKRLVCIVGSKKALWIAIRNNQISRRRTGLKEALHACLA
jgi:exodeoxyribonuclease V alpha subunit